MNEAILCIHGSESPCDSHAKLCLNFQSINFRLSEEDMESDPAVGLLFESTEEGQKVTRSGGNKWKAVFRRIPDAYGTNTENI